MTKKRHSATLVKTTYPCMPFPMIEFESHCQRPCIYCGLNIVRAPEDKTLAKGLENVIQEINNKYLGAYISPTTDAFAPTIKEITHEILEGILPYGKIPLINTKQKIPRKTIELLSKYKSLPIVQISIPTLDEQLIKIYEPGSATIKERLETIKELSRNGINTLGLIMPWLGNIQESYKLISKLKEVGAKRCIASLGIFQESTICKMSNSNNKELQKAAQEFHTQNNLLIGQGNTLPKETRISLYQQLIKIGDEIGLKTKICSTALNPDLTNLDVRICDSFKHPTLKK